MRPNDILKILFSTVSYAVLVMTLFSIDIQTAQTQDLGDEMTPPARVYQVPVAARIDGKASVHRNSRSCERLSPRS